MSLQYSPSQLNNEFSFSLKSKDVQVALLVVVALHLAVFLLGIFGLPSFKVAKKPDITIEIGAAPAASSGPSIPVMPTPMPTTKAPPKEVIPPVVQDNSSPVEKKVEPTTTTTTPPAAAESSGGPASAPTVDADYKAAYLQNPKPPYPPFAFRMKIEGRVIILAEVLTDGRTGAVSIAQSSGNDLLDQSALETVKKWKFTPARKDGVIITQAVRIPITFSLKNR